ncbi:adenylyl cyclase-associated protein 1 isoform X2 [Halyomorpha halys]|uniref:adenylyl cyclase-associated protein 1 isoform X2 n=1 Tax=Halyomorpha halys TaxID=286706 RepID=UPI0034D18EA1
MFTLKGTSPGLRLDCGLESPTQEDGGMSEPPVTPVGRDEVALRRYRFFSEVMTAACGGHRVRFDPRGPSFSGPSEENFLGGHCAELESLVSRLESVATKFEYLLCKLPASTPSVSSPCCENVTEMVANTAGFRDIVDGPLSTFVSLSHKIGGPVAEQANLVQGAFKAQLDYIEIAGSRPEPDQSEQVSLLAPLSTFIQQIQSVRDKNRASPFFNHLSAISESVPALGWVTMKPAPAPYIKEMNDAGQFYTNRVLKDWKEKDKTHVDWTKSWIESLTKLQAYVKEVHTTGLVWAAKGTGPAAPPPPPPPALDTLLLSDSSTAGGDERSALFAEINQGEGITKNLKKVTSEMQTHKNPGLRSGPAPFKPTVTAPAKTIGAAPTQPSSKPPVFKRDGKKWLIEHQKDNPNLIVEGADMNNVVYMFGCINSTLTVKGKVNSVFLDSCRKTSVLVDSLVSSIEIVNCQSVQMQILGRVPTISIDKTDGCQMYLSKETLDVEIVSSKSSEMNVLLPQASGDYLEQPVPEQYKTTIAGGKTLVTSPLENKG